MEQSPSEHFDYIDGLRAIAVLAVIIYHIDASLLPGGAAGVDVFFVISGFVVSSALAKIKASSLLQLLSEFYARRMRRILPALLLMLLVTQALVILFVPQVYLSRFIDDTAFAASLGYANIFLSGHTDYFSPSAAYNPFVHTWSLGVEEQFYVLFPLLYFGLRRDRAKQAIVVTMLCAISLWWGWNSAASTTGAAFYSSAARFWEIGTGVLLQLLLSKPSRASSQEPRREIWPLTLVGIAGVMISFTSGGGSSFPVPGALLPVAAAALVVLGLHRREARSPWAAVLEQRWVRLVGLLSYSLYLWHWPVFVLARWTIGFSSPFQKAIALAITICLSVLSYLVVERPIRKAPLLSRPKKAISFGLVAMTSSVALISSSNMAASQLSLVQAVAQQSIWFPYDLQADEKGCSGVKQEANRLGVDVTWLANACQQQASERTIFVIGDSHAGAYTRMMDMVSRRTGMRIAIHETVGCGFLTLAETSADCPAKTANAVETILKFAKPGDIVFMPGLRIPRFVDESDAAISDAQAITDSWAKGLEGALARGNATLAPLTGKHLKIVVELPKPVLKYAPFRCADWFNHMNPACAQAGPVARSEIESLRAPVIDFVRKLAATQPDIFIWDPLPDLCDAKSCFDYVDGKPLYFDGDHLSGFANERLAPSFTAMLATFQLVTK